MSDEVKTEEVAAEVPATETTAPEAAPSTEAATA